MLYPRGADKHLEAPLFKNPTCEYRGTPFWAWNNKLNEEQLLWQIDMMKQMGLGGFHMHSRTGMATDYLSDEFMHMVRACVDKAKKEKMLAWLYDEDRWPSGAAGGFVTREDKYRARFLLFTPTPYGKGIKSENTNSLSAGHRSESGTLIACYDITLNEGGALAAYKRVPPESKPAQGAVRWYAYVEMQNKTAWYNNESYVDTLNPAAIRRFVEITHERYKQVVGDEFGKTIPAMFTDEPQFSRKNTLGYASELKDVTMPWTDDLPLTYKAAYGMDLLDSLPEVFWNLPGDEPSLARFYFHDHVAERFAQAFADTVGDWCKSNGIALSGHMMEEPTLESQTHSIGDCMRLYRSFQLPGIDMLCDRREFTTAKQAQSAANQYGWPGVLSELYGVTGWDYDFRGHKLQGDWQAALGVTVRVHHLTWVSMEGSSKRDYPASIGYQSPWWKEYRVVEDHFARLNTALTRGKNVARVAVVHPVESYWLHYGPKEQTGVSRQALDKHFQDVTDWLLRGMIDFDYICESTLPQQCPQGGAPLKVGEMAYDAIIVPQCDTLRATTLDRLEAFRKAGGKLVFLGDAPKLCDVKPSARAKELQSISQTAAPTQIALLAALEDVRVIEIRDEAGMPVNNLLHQMRADAGGLWLFVCHADNPASHEITNARGLRIRLKGLFTPTLYDTQTGETREIPHGHQNGYTIIPAVMDLHDSLLYRLDALETAQLPAPSVAKAAEKAEGQSIMGIHNVTLDEPNLLLIDVAEYRLNSEADWRPAQEILRIDDHMRDVAGYPSRRISVAQPWVVPDTASEHTVHLRFAFNSEVAVAGAKLGVEKPDMVSAWLNGEAVTMQPDGYFTDESIKTVKLPEIRAGENVLLVDVPITRRVGVEWLYILGDFGVKVNGTVRTLTAPVRSLGFGSWVEQGLAHYGGNVTYHIDVETDGPCELTIPQYRGALLTVSVDGGAAQHVVYAPYSLPLKVGKGKHRVDIKCFGNRFNCFGAVHNANELEKWHGPPIWRTQGQKWCYEYQLRPVGILVGPRITPST